MRISASRVCKYHTDAQADCCVAFYIAASHESFAQQTMSNAVPGAPLAASPSLTSESSAPSATSDGSFKTPNVYINGLPPNFPEDQLLAMTREFGEVISVRTFTRHVSDKPS